ncbi:hypothetical protein B0A50_00205 [Salinomyces thailandicus]|uniref:Uncharacterized protein n=1 Tax=Salinomyces thailandicus TaxID=706561 RepID=A0A4U0UI11_9PEZI|nr:hypothetical protein B0A50_00205 [Salinomyces thailandica]
MSKHPSLHRQQFEDWVETPGYTYLEEYQPTTQQLQQHAASVAANNQAETKEQEREEDSSELAEEQPHEMISSSESSYALSSSSPSENPRSSTYVLRGSTQAARKSLIVKLLIPSEKLRALRDR